MKNKIFYLTLVLVSALTISSCASRKYGCPNSTGMRPVPATSVNATV